MKNADIRALSADALKEQIAAEKETLQRLQFAHSVSPIENPMRIRGARKLIAKLYTELTVKQKK
jgi:large subunit ribosomal protein L29